MSSKVWRGVEGSKEIKNVLSPFFKIYYIINLWERRGPWSRPPTPPPHPHPHPPIPTASRVYQVAHFLHFTHEKPKLHADMNVYRASHVASQPRDVGCLYSDSMLYGVIMHFNLHVNTYTYSLQQYKLWVNSNLW